MKTRFPFEINIDENKFKLEYMELKKSEARELVAEFAELRKQIDASDALKSEIASLEEKKEIKNGIASTQSGDKKAKTLQEVLALIEQIEAKRAEQKELASASIDLDVAAKKRFDLTLGGADLEKFKAEIENKGLSYLSVMGAIDAAIEAERSKK
nr:hypothetical protein [uncultured Campylobacter sp.]